jgi:hypothetical protein
MPFLRGSAEETLEAAPKCFSVDAFSSSIAKLPHHASGVNATDSNVNVSASPFPSNRGILGGATRYTERDLIALDLPAQNLRLFIPITHRASNTGSL